MAPLFLLSDRGEEIFGLQQHSICFGRVKEVHFGGDKTTQRSVCQAVLVQVQLVQHFLRRRHIHRQKGQLV